LTCVRLQPWAHDEPRGEPGTTCGCLRRHRAAQVVRRHLTDTAWVFQVTAAPARAEGDRRRAGRAATVARGAVAAPQDPAGESDLTAGAGRKHGAGARRERAGLALAACPGMPRSRTTASGCSDIPSCSPAMAVSASRHLPDAALSVREYPCRSPAWMRFLLDENGSYRVCRARDQDRVLSREITTSCSSWRIRRVSAVRCPGPRHRRPATHRARRAAARRLPGPLRELLLAAPSPRWHQTASGHGRFPATGHGVNVYPSSPQRSQRRTQQIK
jgi:hypothetical protein